MRQTQPTPLFNMAQSELIRLSFEKHGYLVRDAADLAARGITPARVAAFDKQRQDFELLPTDIELDAAKQNATLAKEKAQATAVTQLQGIMGIVGTVHDARSASYKMFGSAGLANGPEADLYVGLLRVVRVGRAHLAEYAGAGLTAAMLDELAASAAVFLERLGQQQDAESARGRAADARILAGNALYEELIDLCAIGKARYATTDARKYEDYVVTDAPAPGAGPVPPKA
ncbi:hypothetical protein [Hymenobacter ruricola]|uniref:Uncharacterized protein n=1 Tax=Hymenobacter ruricola TaxID=2791023 RepID=A0ABS0I078_9BACT|nr:hypothetical protein [Hymenobacter ruricola]MBF9220191.1 hypothetical protein [Hymenobacter ruricola]